MTATDNFNPVNMANSLIWSVSQLYLNIIVKIRENFRYFYKTCRNEFSRVYTYNLTPFTFLPDNREIISSDLNHMKMLVNKNMTTYYINLKPNACLFCTEALQFVILTLLQKLRNCRTGHETKTVVNTGAIITRCMIFFTYASAVLNFVPL